MESRPFAIVLWNDESKFQIFGSQRCHYVQRRAGEKYIDSFFHPTVKHGGGSIMIWGVFPPMALVTQLKEELKEP